MSTMTKPPDELMDKIRAAVDIVRSGAVKRVDGDTFKVYRVANVIRIDLMEKEE